MGVADTAAADDRHTKLLRSFRLLYRCLLCRSLFGRSFRRGFCRRLLCRCRFGRHFQNSFPNRSGIYPFFIISQHFTDCKRLHSPGSIFCEENRFPPGSRNGVPAPRSVFSFRLRCDPMGFPLFFRFFSDCLLTNVPVHVIINTERCGRRGKAGSLFFERLNVPVHFNRGIQIHGYAFRNCTRGGGIEIHRVESAPGRRRKNHESQRPHGSAPPTSSATGRISSPSSLRTARTTSSASSSTASAAGSTTTSWPRSKSGFSFQGGGSRSAWCMTASTRSGDMWTTCSATISKA